MKYSLLTLLLLSFFALNAQTNKYTNTKNLPEVYEITSDSVASYTLEGKYWQLLVDVKAKYTLEDAEKLPFKQATGLNETFDYSAKASWSRYRIKNSLKHNVTFFIPEGNLEDDNIRYTEKAIVYALSPNGKWEEHITGTLVPWSQLTDYKRVPGFYFTLKPGDTYLFYEYVHNNNVGNIGVGIQIIKSLPENLTSYYEVLINQMKRRAFLVGFSFLAALIGLLFFYIEREKIYLYFSLLVIFNTITTDNIFYYELFFKDLPAIGRYQYLGVVFMLFFFWRFGSLFYQTGKFYPKWTRFNTRCSYLLFLVMLPFFIKLPMNALLFINIGLIVVFGLNMLVIVILSAVKVKTDLLFNTLTILPLLLLELIPTILRTFLDIQAYEPLLSTLTMAAYYWMLTLFLYRLVMRYKVLQQQILNEAVAREKLSVGLEIEKSRLIEEQKIELEKQVKARTAQLIQSEKMASLGELTAGIAHEIQNPLNFVNNFSEVSSELMIELDEELNKGDIIEAKAIATDIRQNLEKINHHGKRADSIVKGMLEHSRTSTGVKARTDLNKLADECFRLAYHGLRAKDKTFNATLDTKFDEQLPFVDVILQDISRVLLNVLTNAFYAVQEKQKTAPTDYKPIVKLITLKTDEGVQIKISDNGIGIPDNIKDKIMQPFFTTKPTGSGTGLGLSLSYDIIVKGHGGTLQINSEFGEGAELIIFLPTA